MNRSSRPSRPSDPQRAAELDAKSAAFADGLNCLGIALCANGLRVIQEKWGVKDLRETLARSADVCLDFVVFLKAHGLKSRKGVDLEGAEREFAHLRDLLEDPGSLEVDRLAALRRAIRTASAAFGIELPEHPLADHGTCEFHGTVCPPPELEVKKKGA